MSSIQFRSRIKPAFNYGDTLNSYGVCCGITLDVGKQYRSFIECFNEGGHFIPAFNKALEDIECPNSDTKVGCCCACSYMDETSLPTLTPDGNVVSGSQPNLTAGFQSNVSECECKRKGGKWTEGTCPNVLTVGGDNDWKKYCVKGITTDVRVPRSCCHPEFDVFGIPNNIICTDTCSAEDCGDLGSFTYPAIFGSERCITPVIQGQSTTNCHSPLALSIIATNSTNYENYTIGSCYTLALSGENLEYSCSLAPKSLCKDYWIGPQNSDIVYCNSYDGVSGPYYPPSNPILIDGVYQPKTMNLGAYNSLGLTFGDKFQGGINIGTFSTPNDASTSEVYGNLQFTNPTITKYYADSVGLTFQKWALIADTDTYTVPFYTENDTIVDMNTSLWDGYYNTYGDNTKFFGIESSLTNTIKYQNRKGFIDYYIPSIYELLFYAKYLKSKKINNLGILVSSSIFNPKYLNNTNKNILNGNQYVYGISVSSILNTDEENYKTVLVDINTIQRVKFFRRIILT